MSENANVRAQSTEMTRESSPIEKPQRKKPNKKTSSSTTPVPSNFLIHPKLGKLAKRPTSSVDLDGDEVFCLCRGPDNGELMIGCDGCDDWYHFRCVKVPSKYQYLVAQYFCPYCELENKGNTLWKRKCRLSSCFKPISGNESKYCSKDHGLQYLKSVLGNASSQNHRINTKDSLEAKKLNEIVKFASSFDRFRQIGDNLPDPQLDDSYDDYPQVKKLIDKKIELKMSRDLEIKKKRILIKTRENLEKLNETVKQLDTSLSSSSNSKKKVKKIDICGYDNIFRNGKLTMDMKEEDLSSSDAKSLATAYLQLLEDEDGLEIKPDVCLKEKKKCLKHNGWQSMINDDTDSKIRRIEVEMLKISEKREKLIHSLKIDYYEKLAK